MPATTWRSFRQDRFLGVETTHCRILLNKCHIIHLVRYMRTKLIDFLAFPYIAVSAFYAENVQKKIQINAHIYTKSKFLGLAIGVHNIGQGILH